MLYGEWQIDRAVLKSNMYTGTPLDGDFENNIFDPEDYVGYILRYSEESFSLGDVEFANPSYLVSKITVAEYNEGGDFRNPDLYTIIAEEGIEEVTFCVAGLAGDGEQDTALVLAVVCLSVGGVAVPGTVVTGITITAIAVSVAITSISIIIAGQVT